MIDPTTLTREKNAFCVHICEIFPSAFDLVSLTHSSCFSNQNTIYLVWNSLCNREFSLFWAFTIIFIHHSTDKCCFCLIFVFFKVQHNGWSRFEKTKKKLINDDNYVFVTFRKINFVRQIEYTYQKLPLVVVYPFDQWSKKKIVQFLWNEYKKDLIWNPMSKASIGMHCVQCTHSKLALIHCYGSISIEIQFIINCIHSIAFDTCFLQFIAKKK